jgi:hypothetical protein
MHRKDLARLAIGLLTLLLPYAGALTLIPLAAAALLERGVRLLAATLGLLLIARPILSQLDVDLPLSVSKNLSIEMFIYY